MCYYYDFEDFNDYLLYSDEEMEVDMDYLECPQLLKQKLDAVING